MQERKIDLTVGFSARKKKPTPPEDWFPLPDTVDLSPNAIAKRRVKRDKAIHKKQLHELSSRRATMPAKPSKEGK